MLKLFPALCTLALAFLERDILAYPVIGSMRTGQRGALPPGRLNGTEMAVCVPCKCAWPLLFFLKQHCENE